LRDDCLYGLAYEAGASSNENPDFWHSLPSVPNIGSRLVMYIWLFIRKSRMKSYSEVDVFPPSVEREIFSWDAQLKIGVYKSFLLWKYFILSTVSRFIATHIEEKNAHSRWTTSEMPPPRQQRPHLIKKDRMTNRIMDSYCDDSGLFYLSYWSHRSFINLLISLAWSD
jgi:hypothetical protein